ncbi:MAG: lipopolysaccharide transport periplasmic protein LptA [Sulfuricurvum sp.]|uniref:lipopolysaccharide transport periplasmic protein LptA n=1 Tax=Sulfuricurvum sp. TaxID=2025608 RepID=UPI002626ED2A|nr:lipopolysaccharide transport periplasmic protein LptA [uncultured Sulfuricurvum sp.]
MIRSIIFLFPFLALLSTAEELKVVSDNFKGDQQKGVSVFTGHVKITKGFDEMNASKITIYTDKSNKPSKYLAEGDVSFYIVTEQNEKYRGTAQTAVYLPNEGEYQFYKKVDLIRLDDYRRVKGDKVVVNTTYGHATAESANNEPVIMTFTLEDKKPKAKSSAK